MQSQEQKATVRRHKIRRLLGIDKPLLQAEPRAVLLASFYIGRPQ